MYIADKPVMEKTKSEIEAKLRMMGEYVKMSYLQRAAKSQLDFDTRKFVMVELAKVYEQKHMYLDAAKTIKNAAEITTTFREKMMQYMKSVQLTVRGNDFIEAERIFAQALALGNDREKWEMKQQFKQFHFAQVQEYLKQNRRSQAKVLYQKMLTMELNPQEKTTVQNQLLEIYLKLGNTREYHQLKDKMSGGMGLLPP